VTWDAGRRIVYSLNPTISQWYQHEHPENFNLTNEDFQWSFDMSAVLVESKDQDRWNKLKPVGQIDPRFGSLGF
jgi:hypothetical protein